MGITRAFRWVVATALAAGLGTSTPVPTRADSIDDSVRDAAPRIMKYLKDHRYKAVGVLKFVVKKGDKPASLEAGTLNAMMATRLEQALILLVDPAAPIEIVHNASRAASAASRGATFRNPKGRDALLGLSYPVAWGDRRRSPDALLTGEVFVARDMKTLSYVVRAFAKGSPDRLAEVVRVEGVPVDRNVLASIGQSFVLPRKLRRGDLGEAASEDAAGRDDSNANPLRDGDDPVKLQVLYDGQPVGLEPDPSSPGEVRVRRTTSADPKEGQKVKFVVTNASADTVGVVLAVNGKNTLFQEDLASQPAGACTKWILKPGESYTIEGFYMGEDGSEVHPFKVLSDEESARAELSPEHRGVFSLFAFRAGGGGDAADGPNISTEGCGLACDAFDSTLPRSLAEAQAKVRAATRTTASKGRLVTERSARHARPPRHATRKATGRGLVVEDGQSTTGSALNRLDTRFDPEPILSLFIRYYSTPGASAE